MKKIIKPISILVLLVVGCLLLIYPTLKSIHYGIDLQGGFEILYNIEVLKNLIKVREDVIKQAEDFKKEEFEPYTWPMKGSDDKELDKKCHDAIKAHEIKFHMDYIIERTMPSLGVRERASKHPRYEMICDSNGKLKYIRCITCYKEYILNENSLFSREYNDMVIGHEPGAK